MRAIDMRGRKRMRYLYRFAALATLGLLLVVPGCEDTDPIAPSTGQLTVTASPGTIVIDVQEGEDSAQSTIAAQIYSASGFPISGVNVGFTTTGGQLLSSDNSCESSSCRISGDSCTTNGDCPAVPPETVVTNGNGVAIDVLTLNLNDPASVEVSAFSGILTGSATVRKPTQSSMRN